MPILIGTAGWTIPGAQATSFPEGGSHLERYAQVFPAVEINSTFHRPHRASTFERWAASVPPLFRFSLKVPKAITHELRLVNADPLLDVFLASARLLGDRLGCLLVQLPPSLEWDAGVAETFFGALRERHGGGIAIEPRHASWFTREAEEMLVAWRVARVAADPPRGTNVTEPGGWKGLVYFRLHGSPRVYYSSYEDDVLAALAGRLTAASRIPCWCIFDNTTLGAATGNALALQRLVAEGPER